MKIQPPTDAALDRLLYNSETGRLLWKGSRAPAGKKTGRYRRITLDHYPYAEHTLIWYMHTKEWIELDHIDRDGLNNRLENLRPCTRTQNRFNSKVPQNNSSGATGITWDRKSKRWVVRIGYKGWRVHIGRFKSYEDALSARLSAEVQYAGEFSEFVPPLKEHL